jgi:tetratricopeptide (TPR) repeat protein
VTPWHRGVGRRAAVACAALAALSLAVLPPRSARAAGAATRAAKEHYEKAEVAYKLGRFGEALAEYGLAYEAKHLPGLLFNIAQCHKMLGDHEKAVFFYESFLREKPDAPNRALVESLLAESREALESARAAAAARTEAERKEADARAATAAAEARAAADRAAAADAALRVPAPAVGAATKPLLGRWWLWTVVGVVAAGGAAAVIVALSGPRDETVLPSGSLGTLDRR